MGPPKLTFHPGQPLPEGTPLATRFEILERVGEGRCGFVYLCRDVKGDNADRVVKTFDPRRGDQKDEDLFRREVRLLGKLTHPRIPRGYGIYDHQGMLCAPQTFIDGEDLADYVDRRGALPEAEVVDILRQVLVILRDLHEGQPSILHRDLKPENLVRDPDGQVWMIDFGSATDAYQEKRDVPLESITTNQTLGYASPEQVMGLESYPQSDLYALGATVLFLASGVNPIAHFDGRLGRLQWSCAMSDGLRQVLTAMLKLAARDRPANAREVLSMLDSFRE
jgi:serine/threonine protein kinase